MKKQTDHVLDAQQCKATARHIRELALVRKALKAQMRWRRDTKGMTPEEREKVIALIVKLVPIHIKLITLEQELIQRVRGVNLDAEEGQPLTDEDWDILAHAIEARRTDKQD